MKRLEPTHTLAAGVILTVALGILSVVTTPATENTSASGPSVAKATSSVTPEPTATGQAAEATATPQGTEASEAADPTPKRAEYAGVAQINGGLVALSVKNGKAIAYFCDGRIESWLKGTAANNTVTLSGKGATITAALGDRGAKGRLQVGKATWRFSAPLVKKPSGLYRASAVVRGAKVVGGWIILPDGRQVGLVEVGDTSYRAPRLTPGSPVNVDGTELLPQDTDAFIDNL